MRRTIGNRWLILILSLAGFWMQYAIAQASTATAPEVQHGSTRIRIELVGDSTQTDQAGYGLGFCANLTQSVDCMDAAKGGASTKTYRELGLWDAALESKPEYMLIQFGHNDMEKTDGVAANDRQVSMAVYEANLREFIIQARGAGIQPILITPLAIRRYASDGKIGPALATHAAVMQKIAAEMKVPLIDLRGASVAYLDRVGKAEGEKLALVKKDGEGKSYFDDTHLNLGGSYVFGRMVAVGLGTAVPSLQQYVRVEAAVVPAADARE